MPAKRSRKQKRRTQSAKRTTRSRKPRSLQRDKRSWHEMAPKRGRERAAMKSKCGATCFLDAKNLKYPVCPMSKARRPICRRNALGLKAAASRAGQYHHPALVRKAQMARKSMH